MTVDLILHGVPNGQDIWGANDDTHYFSTFYKQKDEKESLTVEARKVSGKSYCYYNYLKYNGVTASDERAGSYIGITLRFDAYYKDVMNVYHLCEIIYNNLSETIFVKSGDNIKFKIAKFNEVDRELNEIKKKIVNLINLSAMAKDFTNITDSFFNNDGKIIRAFLLDCTPDNVMQALVKYGKVEISKYFSSINETKKIKNVEERYTSTLTQKDKDLENITKQNEDLKSDQRKLQNELENKAAEITNLNALISEKDKIIKNNEESVKEIDSLKKKSQELKSKLKAKNQEIDSLKVELSQYKDNVRIPELLKEIKAPLNTLAEVAGRQLSTFPDIDNSNIDEDPSADSTDDKKCCKKNNSFWSDQMWQNTKVVLLVLTLCCSLYCAVKLTSPQNTAVDVDIPESTTYIKEPEDTSKTSGLDDTMNTKEDSVNSKHKDKKNDQK